MTATQEDKEGLANFTKRFKQVHDNTKKLLGEKVLYDFMETTKEFTEKS